MLINCFVLFQEYGKHKPAPVHPTLAKYLCIILYHQLPWVQQFFVMQEQFCPNIFTLLFCVFIHSISPPYPLGLSFILVSFFFSLLGQPIFYRLHKNARKRLSFLPQKVLFDLLFRIMLHIIMLLIIRRMELCSYYDEYENDKWLQIKFIQNILQRFPSHPQMLYIALFHGVIIFCGI